ncbi:MAG TPA: alkaline phosphatase family protein [Acidimicrobiia bacterium]|jgi:hypothetical protein
MLPTRGSFDPPLVVLLILDAFDPRRLNPHLTPNLWRWANADGAAAGTGQAVMAACTYPNHASFVTGVPPADHGIFANHVIRDGRAAGAWEVGPLTPTLFDQYGTDALAVLGDHHLVGVMGAGRAAAHWPDRGEVPLDVELDLLGYPADGAVMPRLVAALGERARLTVGYLGSIDTISHVFGPASDEATDAYGRVDERLAEIEAALDWDSSVVIVLSDHIQHEVEDRPGIDLRAAVGGEVLVADEGSAALVGEEPEPALLMAIDGVTGMTRLGDGNTLVECRPGRYFGPYEDPIFRGVHGNEATRTQLVLASGGHASRAIAAAAVNRGRVLATAWAGIVRQLLDSGA